MLSEFDYMADPDSETWHHFAVLFRYSQDEIAIQMAVVGHTEFDRE
jgi:hypothetical protein